MTQQTKAKSYTRLINDHSSITNGLTSANSESSQQTLLASKAPPFYLRLCDNKTRRSGRLPSHGDTLSARLQLMIYHRMLSQLLAGTYGIHLEAFWSIVGVNPMSALSEDFLHSCGFESGHLSLHNISEKWRATFEKCEIGEIDDDLSVVYRVQSLRPWGYESSLQDDGFAAEDIVRAVKASLEDVPVLEAIDSPRSHPQKLHEDKQDDESTFDTTIDLTSDDSPASVSDTRHTCPFFIIKQREICTHEQYQINLSPV